MNRRRGPWTQAAKRLEKSSRFCMGPYLFSRVSVIANDKLGFAALLLCNQVWIGHRERAPGRADRNSPHLFRRVGLPVVAESQSMQNAIVIGAAQSWPLRLQK